MVPFADVADLSAYLAADDFTSAAAYQALSAATDMICDFCGWNIIQETVTVTLDGEYRRVLWLPTLRLTAVTSVVENSIALVYDTDYTWTSTGRLIRYGRWPSSARSVTVTYTHGYPVPPGAVQQVCLGMAARALSNPLGLRSESVDGVSWTAAGTGGDLGTGLTASDRVSLAPYRILPVA